MNSISTCGSIHSLVEELMSRLLAEAGRIEVIIMAPDMAKEIFYHYTSLFELHGREKNSQLQEDDSAFKFMGLPVLRNPFLPVGHIQLVSRTDTIKLKNAT